MSAEFMDWELIPERVFQAFQRRVELVELLLDPTVDNSTKREQRRRYREEHRVGDRTIRNYLHRYRKKGPRGLLFYRPRPPCPRIPDQQLREKILQLVHELPTRSVPQLRRLLAGDELYGPKMAQYSDRTVYRFLVENGLSKRERYRLLSETSRFSYHRFEAANSMALVQADARDGIWLDLPDGSRRKTYLFLWIDDFSRKLLYGKYYFDEKLPCLEDSFKYMILRYGIPAKQYCDNGKVYIARHFLAVLIDLGIKQVRHQPYCAYCKGKIEADMKIILNQFQREAALADFHTLEELNSAFWAWMELDYNKRVHSSTGQSPDDRFLQGLPEAHRRITDLQHFNALFLWRENRTVTKYGRIKLHGNQYPVTSRPHGSVVEVRYDPFDLKEVAVYDGKGTLLETTSVSKQVTRQAPCIPEESRKTARKISEEARRYFSRLREQHHQEQLQNQETPFSAFLKDSPKNNDPQEEKTDAR
ncbi:MAG: DDE-type integrase/transposase/recombinase [Spirochaetales bacterium]|nr:DDE-type integrase/transposase/recombinase [Spirochaetales bacterium]